MGNVGFGQFGVGCVMYAVRVKAKGCGCVHVFPLCQVSCGGEGTRGVRPITSWRGVSPSRRRQQSDRREKGAGGWTTRSCTVFLLPHLETHDSTRRGNDVHRIHLSNGGLPIPGRSLPSTSTARCRALMALRARRKLNDGRQHCSLFVQRKLTN